MRDGIVFYRSFFEAVKDLPPEDFKNAVMAILEYGINGNEIESSGIAKTVFILTKPQIDANIRRQQNGSKNKSTEIEPKHHLTDTEVIPKPHLSHTESEAKEKDKDKVKDKDKNNIIYSAKFAPPTKSQIDEYCREKGYAIDADRFIDFYESKGWMVGKNKMKDWKAAVRNWNRSQRQELATKGSSNKFNNFNQREYNYAELEKQLLERDLRA